MNVNFPSIVKHHERKNTNRGDFRIHRPTKANQSIKERTNYNPEPM
jgi:hypothetical protein